MPQPDDTPDLLRSAADSLNRGDIEGYLALIDPEVEFTSMIAEAEGETFHGHEGVRRWWDTVRGAFEEARWEFLDIRTEGEDGVIACIRISGVLGGVPVEQMMWQTVRLRDRRAIWWALFRTEDEAREALE